MSKKALYLSLLLTTSPALLADNIYDVALANEQSSQHVIPAGVGLVVGSLVAGPLGAIIGGSMGALVGDQQSKSSIIDAQAYALEQLELELYHVKHDRDLIAANEKTAQNTIKTLQQSIQSEHSQHQHYMAELADSYQLDIYFMTNSSGLSLQAQLGLDKLALLLKNNPHISAKLVAHSDWRGSADDNCVLAEKRLESVSTHLLQQGSTQQQLLSTSYGEQFNQHQGSWAEDLFYDRRVTISLSYFVSES